MTIDREREREVELESAMFTNCLLLGLDPAVIGIQNGAPRVGLFRHSNPKMGELLLYFILSSLRGPIQSAKDFDKVWPIFDNSQSREFRKIVQGIITELESQGALPRSNSRVSSLATCCGQRFVELLWQLSFHALREVHQRTFVADTAVNPLPSSLTDVAYNHASTLLPVTKARIALERRRFLKSANTAVHSQDTWSSLAHDMTAEFRGLCAEEAYLQHELEKLQNLRNKAKLDVELWDDSGSSSFGLNSRLVSKATRLWESLLARKGQHEVLASGPIEDLIAHREHRYRISGSALLAAMDQSSHVPRPDTLSVQPGDPASIHSVDQSEQKCSFELSHFLGNDETVSRIDDRSGRVYPIVDVAEILRRWTHALQRIHKQSLYLAKANDGEGPELVRSSTDSCSIGHAESLAATLAEHRQHLASIQVLISQLKEVIPDVQETVSELEEQVNSLSFVAPMAKYDGRSGPLIQSQSSGRVSGSNVDEDVEPMDFSSVPLEKVSLSPALKLPPLFSLTPNSSGKGGLAQKRNIAAPQVTKLETSPRSNILDRPSATSHEHNPTQDSDNFYLWNLRRSVREAALALQPNSTELSQVDCNVDNLEHFFVPLSESGFSHMGADIRPGSKRTKQRLFVSPEDHCLQDKSSDTAFDIDNKLGLVQDMLKQSITEYDNRVILSIGGSSYAASDSHGTLYDLNEAQDQVFSPPLLTESSISPDEYEDFLGYFFNPQIFYESAEENMKGDIMLGVTKVIERLAPSNLNDIQATRQLPIYKFKTGRSEETLVQQAINVMHPAPLSEIDAALMEN